MRGSFDQLRHAALKSYEFSESELDAFLAQPTPRAVPDALNAQTHSTTADLAGFLAGAGGLLFAPLIIGPFLLWDRIGAYAIPLSLTGLLVTVYAVRRIIRKIRSMPTLLRDGVLVTGRFDEVEFKHNDIGGTWYATLQFEVDGETYHVTRSLRGPHGDLAAWLCDTDGEIPILYAETAPRHCRWAGELVYPCPAPPEHD